MSRLVAGLRNLGEDQGSYKIVLVQTTFNQEPDWNKIRGEIYYKIQKCPPNEVHEV